MDYRRPLFQLEQWSPFLARKIWGLTTLLESPLTVALGLKVHHLNDLSVEVEVPLNRMNRNESGHLRSSVLLAAGELASKLVWARHLDPRLDELNLGAVHCRFLKQAAGNVKVRSGLGENDRERWLRKLRVGESSDVDMAVIFVDERDQQIASMNCVWNLKPLRPVALSEGRSSSSGAL